jgi:hypothetical protein
MENGMPTFLAKWTITNTCDGAEGVLVEVSLFSTEHGAFTESFDVFAPITAASLNAAVASRAADIANNSLSAGITSADIIMCGPAV